MDATRLLTLLKSKVDGGDEVRVGIMGGTFDPIHNGHIALARAAFDELSLDGVLFIPAGNPSFKRDRDVADTCVRFELLQVALDGEEWAAPCDIELSRPGITYTADTMRELSRLLGKGFSLVFIMGGDSLATFESWREPHVILDLCEIAVASREGYDIFAATARIKQFHPGCTIHVLACDVPTVSSTDLRERIRNAHQLGGLLPPRVETLIRTRHLYGCLSNTDDRGGMTKKKDKSADVSPSNLAAPWEDGFRPLDCASTRLQRSMIEQLRCDVEQRLSGKRLTHVRNVAQTSAWLAMRCGVDLFEAEVAGLLHDWDKKLSAEELWEKVERFGIDVPRQDGVVPVLHGLTAAASLALEYPELPSSVFQAIARHTTGAPGMSDLDMVVYVADMIEPGRVGQHIAALRNMAQSCSLREVYAQCVRFGLIHLLESGRFVYPGALDVWNDCRMDAPASQK